MDFHASDEFAVDEATNAGDSEAAPALVRAVPESELDFFARRALQESRLAKLAKTPQAAAAHQYLAAAYSAQVAKELAKAAALEDLVLQIR